MVVHSGEFEFKDLAISPNNGHQQYVNDNKMNYPSSIDQGQSYNNTSNKIPINQNIIDNQQQQNNGKVQYQKQNYGQPGMYQQDQKPNYQPNMNNGGIDQPFTVKQTQNPEYQPYPQYQPQTFSKPNNQYQNQGN